MNKEEIMLVLRTYDAIIKLENLISAMTQKAPFIGTEFEDLFCISELLYQQCSFYRKNNDKCYGKFMEIVSNAEISLEEKYNRLMGED